MQTVEETETVQGAYGGIVLSISPLNSLGWDTS